MRSTGSDLWVRPRRSPWRARLPPGLPLWTAAKAAVRQPVCQANTRRVPCRPEAYAEQRHQASGCRTLLPGTGKRPIANELRDNLNDVGSDLPAARRPLGSASGTALRRRSDDALPAPAQRGPRRGCRLREPGGRATAFAGEMDFQQRPLPPRVRSPPSAMSLATNGRPLEPQPWPRVQTRPRR